MAGSHRNRLRTAGAAKTCHSVADEILHLRRLPVHVIAPRGMHVQLDILSRTQDALDDAGHRRISEVECRLQRFDKKGRGHFVIAEHVEQKPQTVRLAGGVADNVLLTDRAMSIRVGESATDDTKARELITNETKVATKGELDNFLTHLTDQLDACGFLRNQPKRPGMVRNIRHLFERGEVTEQELRTLHGIVTELAEGRG